MGGSRLVRIALTGGPCSGKTSALAFLQQKLDDIGVPAVFVDETATKHFGNGLRRLFDADPFRFQLQLMYHQLEEEEQLGSALAEIPTEMPRVLICDRGAMDVKAYVTKQEFTRLIDAVKIGEVELLDRYDVVIHLVTSADGAVEFYTLANNPARRETPEQARVLDKKTQDAWLGCEHLRVVDNRTDFAGKLARVWEIVLHTLGLPVPVEDERKYLVGAVDEEAAQRSQVSFGTVCIRQDYLLPRSDDDPWERRIRRRTIGNHSTYFYTEKRPVSDDPDDHRRFERTQRIGAREYLKLLLEVDTLLKPIVKTRRTFIWDRNYFELDNFAGHLGGLCLLELERTRHDPNYFLPSFLTVIREVTADPRYKNAELAQHGLPR